VTLGGFIPKASLISATPAALSGNMIALTDSQLAAVMDAARNVAGGTPGYVPATMRRDVADAPSVH